MSQSDSIEYEIICKKQKKGGLLQNSPLRLLNGIFHLSPSASVWTQCGQLIMDPTPFTSANKQQT